MKYESLQFLTLSVKVVDRFSPIVPKVAKQQKEHDVADDPECNEEKEERRLLLEKEHHKHYYSALTKSFLSLDEKDL